MFTHAEAVLNEPRPSVYQTAMFMRLVPLPLFIGAIRAFAQPSAPDISFALAANDEEARPFTEVHSVQLRYQDTPLNGPTEGGPLASTPLFADTRMGWRHYRLGDCACTGMHVLVIAGSDTMRIDFPDANMERWMLIQHAMGRWDRNTPQVIRFRKGRFAFAEWMKDPWSEAVSNTFAQRLIAEEQVLYREQLAAQEAYYRNQPPPAPKPSVQQPPPPTLNQAAFDSIAAAWRHLSSVVLDRSRFTLLENVEVRITGTVMLDGGCASTNPMFSVWRMSAAGWVELVPFPNAQMDCGMPSVQWTDHVLALDLGWWIRVHSGPTLEELEPGTYRLVFMGGDTKKMMTAPFEVVP